MVDDVVDYVCVDVDGVCVDASADIYGNVYVCVDVDVDVYVYSDVLSERCCGP